MQTPAQPAILVLGRDTCSDSVRSMAHLRARGIAFTYRNVEFDPGADALIRSFHDGVRVTPTILLGDVSAPARVLTEPSDEDLDRAIAEVAVAG